MGLLVIVYPEVRRVWMQKRGWVEIWTLESFAKQVFAGQVFYTHHEGC